MRDLDMMRDTLTRIALDGDRNAECVPLPSGGYDWFAGNTRLNAQIVADMLADGWLTIIAHTPSGRPRTACIT